MFLKLFRNSKNDISFDDFQKMKKTTNNIYLLDVRSRQEYKEGHLENSINIPLYELQNECNSRIKNKEDIIVVYCQSGIRSIKAIKILYKNGYKNLYNLKNGLDGI